MFERGFHSNFFRVSTPFAVIKQNKIQITLEMVFWPCKKTEYLQKKYERTMAVVTTEAYHAGRKCGSAVCLLYAEDSWFI
jgi:hypothetical protein